MALPAQSAPVLCFGDEITRIINVGWSFTGFSDGRTGKFAPHKPLEMQPDIFYGYSDTQRSECYGRNGKKVFAVQHLVAGNWKRGACSVFMRMIADIEVSVME